MTDSDQAECAGVIKKVHAELRSKCQEDGSTVEDVWRAHLSSSNEAQLSEYATSMHRLATDVWDKRHGGAPQLSRIAWLHRALLNYHTEPELARARAYDDRLAERHGLTHQWPSASDLTDLPAFDTLDVGSCYGPFSHLPRLRVTALDLCPAVPSVLRADLLSVPLSDRTVTSEGRLCSLATGFWHAVIFCLLLEYLPTPPLRYECCRRAAALLRPEGVLLVASPDSAHRTANGPLYRAWRLALATLGLVRVRYEKTEHLHCMVFRKSVHPAQVALEARAQIAQDAVRGRLVWSRRSSARLSPSSEGSDGVGRARSRGSGPTAAEATATCGPDVGGTERCGVDSNPGPAARCAEDGTGGPQLCDGDDPSRLRTSDSLEPPPGGASDSPEGPSQPASDCPEPYQLMVIHQDLKPTVLKSRTEKAPSSDFVNVEDGLSELPQL